MKSLPSSSLWKAVLLGLTLSGYALAGLSTLHMEGLPRIVRNGVSFSEPVGVRFPSPGLARTSAPPEWLPAATRSSQLELDLSARAFRCLQRGPARLLTVSSGTSMRNLTLGQEGADLVIRLRTPVSSPNGEPAHTIAGVFGDGGYHDIRVTISERRLQTEVDGKMVMSDPLPDHPLAGWDLGYPLLLGNELGGQRPWLGEIRRATIRSGGRAYEYATQSALVAPGHYWTLGGRVSWDGTHRTSSGRLPDYDRILNFAGFLPLGGLLVLLYKRLSILRAVLICALVSAVIETGQLWLPGRDPQWSDLLLNVLGGSSGALLARVAARLPFFPSTRINSKAE
jgi:VanZ family protein